MPTGTMVQAELGYGTIYLTVTREMPDPVPMPSSKAGGLDIGVIHLGMVSDGEEAVAISGRGLRSVKQGRAKALTKLQKKRSRTQPGSRRRKRLNRARHRTSQQSERITRNALHHAANQIVAFCLATGITILYAGDLGTLNHHKRHRRSRRTNQEVGALEFGRWEQYLEYKLRRHGIPLVSAMRPPHQGGGSYLPLSRLRLSGAPRWPRCGEHPQQGEAWGDSPGEYFVPPTDHVSPSRPSQEGVKAQSG